MLKTLPKPLVYQCLQKLANINNENDKKEMY